MARIIWTPDDPTNTWQFRQTGRKARVKCIISTSGIDIAVFEFRDEPGERRVPVRAFLRDFEWRWR